LNIRLATAADVPAIIALERQCASAAHWTEVQYQHLFEEQMAGKSPQRLVLVIEEKSETASRHESSNSTPLGFLVAHNIDREWELENIAVAPFARRRGLATVLVQELFHRAREADGKAVFLEVRESNQFGRALYEKLGFSPSGCRKGYYQNPLQDAVLYRRALP
jgi:[ribosomal protein S18]-alanine N-acetyltransferase